MKSVRLFIVVPCFNEQDVLPATHGQLLAVLSSLINNGTVTTDSKLLYVDDGSDDGTWTLIDGFCRQGDNTCGIKLAANRGQQNSLLAGIDAATEHADAIITIDADLQDDIGVIPEMLRLYAEGNDIVYGVRDDRRSDSWLKRTTAKAFYKAMGWLGVNTVYNHADFRLMSNRAVRQLLQYGERNLFLRGIVPQLGYRTACVHYDRRCRQAGRSKYPAGKMLGFAADGITSFSIRPVRLVLMLGLVFLLIALGMLTYALIAYFMGRAVSGWASLMLSLWFIGGCVLFGLGIVGEYIGKIYIEVKGRPRYNVERRLMGDNENENTNKNQTI